MLSYFLSKEKHSIVEHRFEQFCTIKQDIYIYISYVHFHHTDYRWNYEASNLLSPGKGNFPSRYYFHSGAFRDICRVVKEETIRPGRVLKVEGEIRGRGGGEEEMNEPWPT